MKYPELDKQAQQIADETLHTIYKMTTETNIPHKAQYILEKVIKILQDHAR